MRRFVALGFLLGLLLGAALGVLVSSNFYEYHYLAPASGESAGQLVNQGGWEPVPGSFSQGGTRYYRRPRMRLGN